MKYIWLEIEFYEIIIEPFIRYIPDILLSKVEYFS